jgi:hypothetical protein
MRRTYMEMYENEERAAEITIRDEDDVDFEPTGVFAQIVDSNDDEIIAETACLVVDNKAYALVSDTVTAVPGKYVIIWRIMKTSGDFSYKYFHKTDVVVEEL